MDPVTRAAHLIIHGYVVIPDVLSPAEVEAASEAFERLAAAHDKRHMTWDEIALEPALLHYLAHPNLMPVVDAFGAHYDQTMVFTNSSGIRDTYNGTRTPQDPIPPITKLGWHDDVLGVKVPCEAAMMLGLTCLLYLDETFPTNGAYHAAAGSHHLAHYDADGKAMIAPAELVYDVCELRALPVKPGSVIIHRGHNWHGVMPACQRRRLYLQTYGPTSSYDQQNGHTQLSDETIALVPPDRHRYIRHYSTADKAE